MKSHFYLIFLLSISFILVGCNNHDSNQFVIVDEANSTSEGEKPTLEVDVQVNGDNATVIIDTDLKISVEEYGKEKVNGQGHIHVYLNNGEKQGVTSVPYELPALEKGNHVVRVSLHNNDHTPYGVSETMEFEIK